MIKRLVVDVLYCNKCKTVIWSRYRHDFKYCKCESAFIDGGGEYTRYGGNEKHFKMHQITLTQNPDIKTHKEYVDYVDFHIKHLVNYGFFKLEPLETPKRYNKAKEVMEWVKKQIFQLYRTRK
jgi:hypothetical protein